MLTTTVTLEGNLATRPELQRNARKGVPVTEFVVLVNCAQRDPDTDLWTDAEPTRHRVKVYGTLAAHTVDLKVGTTLLVHGRIETERWTDKDTGQPRTTDRVIADAIGASLRFATIDVHKTRTTQAAA